MRPAPAIENLILTVRGQRVILAGDLAVVYDVETRVLNQAIKRNLDRFPDDFMFQLTAAEFMNLKSQGAISSEGRSALRSQSVILKRGRHTKFPPQAFTEHGAIMAATVLNSARAVAMSVYVVRAFVRMREQLAANAAILRRLTEIDRILLRQDASLRDIYQKLLPLLQPPETPRKRRIGFLEG
jgi:hypothetical protein